MATLRKDGRWMARKQGKTGYGKTPEAADADLSRKLNPEPDTPWIGNEPTLHEVAKRYWFPHIQTLQPTSEKRYRGCWLANFRPIAGVKVKDLSTEQIAVWVRDLQGAANTRRFTICVLRQLLSYASDFGHEVAPVAWRRVATPKKPEKRKRVLSVDQAAELLERVEGTPLSAPVFLALILGLRRGEVAGLKWDALDRVKGELEIKAQRMAVKGGHKTSLPKGGKTRTLRLTPDLIAQIDRRGDLDNAYICTYGGEPWIPQTIKEKWDDFKGDALKDWSYHDLRHGAAGLIYAATQDLLIVQSVLGHATVDMSLGYTDIDQASLTKLSDAVFGRAVSTVTHPKNEV